MRFNIGTIPLLSFSQFSYANSDSFNPNEQIVSCFQFDGIIFNHEKAYGTAYTRFIDTLHLSNNADLYNPLAIGLSIEKFRVLLTNPFYRAKATFKQSLSINP
jgi:hypothetical protein